MTTYITFTCARCAWIWLGKLAPPNKVMTYLVCCPKCRFAELRKM